MEHFAVNLLNHNAFHTANLSHQYQGITWKVILFSNVDHRERQICERNQFSRDMVVLGGLGFDLLTHKWELIFLSSITFLEVLESYANYKLTFYNK